MLPFALVAGVPTISKARTRRSGVRLVCPRRTGEGAEVRCEACGAGTAVRAGAWPCADPARRFARARFVVGYLGVFDLGRYEVQAR